MVTNINLCHANLYVLPKETMHRMSILPRFLLISCALAMLGGCAAGTDYKAPALKLPALFGNSSKAESALAVSDDLSIRNTAQWWTQFNDIILNELVARALNNNQNLKSTQARIAEARGLRRTSIGILFPILEASGNAGRNKSESQSVSNNSGAQFDASWEVDLFGGNRRSAEASGANVSAAIADYNAASLSLAAEVARQYIEYRYLQHQVALARQSVAAQNEIAALTRDLYNADLTSGLEVSQAESLVETTRANVPLYERSLEATRQSLAVLLGVTADELPQEQLEKTVSIPLALGLPFVDAPAIIIARRPDIVAAERRFASATALTSAELATLYPSLSLSGLFGFNDTSGGRNNGSGSIWSLGTNIAAPLLNFGVIQGRIDTQSARAKAAYYTYRQSVLEAVADVETSLSGFAYETQRHDGLSSAVGKSRETVRLARLRYENGLTAFTDVLQAQQDLYVREQALAESEAARAQALVAIYKSLGVAPILSQNEK